MKNQPETQDIDMWQFETTDGEMYFTCVSPIEMRCYAMIEVITCSGDNAKIFTRNIDFSTIVHF